jgi:subtilisin family serine protease
MLRAFKIVGFALAASAIAVAGWSVGMRYADGGPAPPKWETINAEMPDRVIKLPDNEIAPEEMVVIAANAGDVADWGHGVIDVPAAWKLSKGKGAKVAVLDTGCDFGHRDLKRVTGKDFTGSRSGAADVNGHGTHCLGVVGADENGEGVVGVAPEADMISGKVLGDNGSGLSSWIANGIDWAISEKVDVISMSLGSDAPDQRIGAAVERARQAGIIVVAAAGNSGPRENTAGWPGRFPGVVCVGAVDSDTKTANFSSRGAALVVAAPGVNVRSCYPGDRFATMSGTSMATPYVAGVAALYVGRCKEAGVKWSAEEFARLIQKTSRDLAPAGRDTATGFGLVQPAKLLAELVPSKPDVPVMPPPKDPDTPPAVDRIEIVPPPGFTANGKPITKIILELGSVKP